MALLATAEDRKVPLISTNGAKAFNSTYGFTLGNGGVSEEGTLVAGWLRERALHTDRGNHRDSHPEVRNTRKPSALPQNGIS